METAHFHRLADFNTVKMSMLPSVINRFSAVPIKILRFFFLTEIEKYTSKVNMESKGSQSKKSWTKIKLEDLNLMISKLTTKLQ